MLQKLFTTADGKIPFIQIALGAIIGAIGVLIYVRFYKPKILFPSTPTSSQHKVQEARVPLKRKVETGRSDDQRIRQQPGYDPDEGLVGAPVVLDLGTLHPGGPRAPELPMPTMFPPQEDDMGSDDEDDEDEDEIDEDEVMVSSTGKSGISELP